MINCNSYESAASDNTDVLLRTLSIISTASWGFNILIPGKPTPAGALPLALAPDESLLMYIGMGT